jgi:hypothetical protein
LSPFGAKIDPDLLKQHAYTQIGPVVSSEQSPQQTVVDSDNHLWADIYGRSQPVPAPDTSGIVVGHLPSEQPLPVQR